MEAPPVQYARTSDGYSIAYTDSGRGIPFVWVAGPITHARLDWLAPKGSALEQLARRVRLITYDARGHGMSARPVPEDYVLSDDELDLEAVVAATGIDRFVLFAGYYFGHVAMRYAVRNPERVRALILWNSRVGGQGTRGRSYNIDMAAEDWALFVDVTARVIFSLEDPEAAKQRVRESITQLDMLRRSVPTRDSGVADIASLLVVPVLVLVTTGIAMAAASEEDGQKLAAIIPGSRLVVIAHPDGGLHSDEPGPKPALHAIDDFLATLPPEAASQEVTLTTPRPQFQVLSPREVEILRFVVAGKSSREIGEELVLSVRTVERHIANIYLKTETHGRAQVTNYARDNGLY